MRIRNNSEVLSVINRFMWVDNSTFKFITIQGIERLIKFDAKGNFEEIEFNIIPGFSDKETEKEHFYTGTTNCFSPEDVE
jgi:hypothetical protein